MERQTIEKKLTKVKTNRALAKMTIDLLARDTKKQTNKIEIIKERDIIINWIDEKLSTCNYSSMTKQGLENSRYNLNTIK